MGVCVCYNIYNIYIYEHYIIALYLLRFIKLFEDKFDNLVLI